MIKYTYVACLIVVMWFIFAVYGLIVFMVYWTVAYSEPCQTSKKEFFVKIVTLKEITSFLRRLVEF